MKFIELFKQETAAALKAAETEPAYLLNKVEEVVVEVETIVQSFRDNATKEVDLVIAKLEAIITAKTKEVETKLAAINVLTDAKTLASVEISKAQDAIAKFKALPTLS